MLLPFSLELSPLKQRLVRTALAPYLALLELDAINTDGRFQELTRILRHTNRHWNGVAFKTRFLKEQGVHWMAVKIPTAQSVPGCIHCAGAALTPDAFMFCVDPKQSALNHLAHAPGHKVEFSQALTPERIAAVAACFKTTGTQLIIYDGKDVEVRVPDLTLHTTIRPSRFSDIMNAVVALKA